MRIDCIWVRQRIQKRQTMSAFNLSLFTKKVKETMFLEMSRKNQRLSVRDFAKEIKISAATFSRISTGKQPDIETFFKTCQWMDLPADFFYNRSQTKTE
jgi:DNA-binding XRE family transcriptional regulator